MTDTTATNGTGPISEPLFIRPRQGRMLAGVCAGIAQRWHVDVTLVRVCTALLVLLSGVGVVAYVAAWALTPTVDGPAPLHPDSPLARTLANRAPALLRRGMAAVLILLVAAGLIGLLHRLVWWGGGWGWGWLGIGLGAPLGLIAIVAAVAVIVGSRVGRLLVVGVVALLVLAVTLTGVFGSGFGSRSFAVGSVRDLQGSYTYPVGTVHLDLTGLSGVTGRRHTYVRVGSGDVTVAPPAGVPVLVRGRAGIGSVTIDGHRTSGFDTAQTMRLDGADPTGRDELIVNVAVGVGSVTVT